MVDLDIEAEAEATEKYKTIQKVADAEGDPTTCFIFDEILEREEDHCDFFTCLEEGKKPVKCKQARTTLHILIRAPCWARIFLIPANKSPRLHKSYYHSTPSRMG